MTDQPTDATAASETTEEEASEQVMDLLSEHVPLSLIMDLSSPAGPDSEQILEAEGEPKDAWWEPVSTDGSESTASESTASETTGSETTGSETTGSESRQSPGSA